MGSVAVFELVLTRQCIMITHRGKHFSQVITSFAFYLIFLRHSSEKVIINYGKSSLQARGLWPEDSDKDTVDSLLRF